MQIQVKKENYNFERYVSKRRWMSYYYQIDEALKSGCGSFLLIGKGDGIVPAIIANMMNIGISDFLENDGIIDTFDFDRELNTTYIGDIREIAKIVKKKYDCVICCQVLEHVEYKYFEMIIEQIRSICTYRIILSLPVRRLIFFAVSFDIPKIHKAFSMTILRFWEKKLPWNGEHYWEVGNRNHMKKDIVKILERHFQIVKKFTVPENTYHWFIILSV